MESPTVSVVLPTYDRADRLPRSIESVLDQGYTDLELVVVDDASTDDTPSVVRGYDDDRVRFVRLEDNRGAPVARNVGIELARGDYVAFQDSDDEWLPEKLAAQMRVFERAPDSVGVVYTGFARIQGDAETYVPGPNVSRTDGEITRALLHNNFITTSAAVVRSSCLDEVGGFDPSFPRFQDWELWIRLSRRYEFRCIDRRLVNQYIQPDSISNDRSRLVAAKERLLRKHADAFETLPDDVLAAHYARLGRFLLGEGDDSGVAYLRRAFRLDPRPRYAVLAIAGSIGLGNVVGIT